MQLTVVYCTPKYSESCCSVTQLCPTLFNHMDFSMPGFPVLHHLLKFAQTYVHSVSDAIKLSHPLSPPSHPAFSLSPNQGSFPMSWLFSSGDQSIGASASASALPMNIQDWFPLQLTALISLQSKGLWTVFSNTTVQKDQSSVLSFLYGSTLRSICDYWKDRHCDYVELCKQSNASAF